MNMSPLGLFPWLGEIRGSIPSHGERRRATSHRQESSGTSSLGTNLQATLLSLSSKTGEEEQMRKEDAWQGVELRSDRFRQ